MNAKELNKALNVITTIHQDLQPNNNSYRNILIVMIKNFLTEKLFGKKLKQFFIHPNHAH
jgi:hypothetical protein